MSNGQVHIVPRTRSLTGVQILGSGSYVPDNVVSNSTCRTRTASIPNGS